MTETQNVPFHSIPIGGRFKYHGYHWEKTGHGRTSCCGKRNNAVNLDLEQMKIFGRNDKIEITEPNDNK